MIRLLLTLFVVHFFEQSGNNVALGQGIAKKPPGFGNYLENSVLCLDKSIRYRKRPMSLVKVRTQLAIIAVFSLSSIDMDLTADLYLYQSWRDSRCGFRGLPGQGSILTLYTGKGGSMSHPGLANLWQPDTNFLNAKNEERPEVVTSILSTGIIQTRTRFSVTTSCPMDLRLFPMDRQMCSFIIQSSAHPMDELTYFWKHGNESKLPFIQGLTYQDSMTPGIKLLAYRFREADSLPDDLTGEKYHQLIVDIFIERPLGYFLWEVYMPATFIVIISFSSFWFDRAATPARVSLGITTVLTITTLLSSANVNLPQTAYPKAIGVFLAGCFIFTFLAFLEYSIASFLERKRPTGPEFPSAQNFRRPDPQSTNKLPPPHVPLKRAGDNDDVNEDIEAPPPPGNTQAKFSRGRRFTLVEVKDPMGNWRPSAVELYSRLLFPLAFVAFQIGYWVTCYVCQDEIPDDAVRLVREKTRKLGNQWEK